MEIYYNIDEINFDTNRAITIGGFDGIHLGHQKIFDTLFVKAEEQNLKKIVITFEPLPKHFFNLNNNQLLLTPMNEKIKILKNKGIDEMFIIKFNEEMSKLSAYSFVELLIHKIGFKVYVVGENHTFGNNCEGNLASLNKLKKCFDNQFEVYGVTSYVKKNNIISSTLIKNQILDKNIEKINELLGYNYSIIGQVVKGNEIGRQLGFPTANIKIPENKIIPKNGVYLVQIELQNNKYFGIANLGLRPTIKQQISNKPYLEVHIFNFNNDIYRMELCVNFLQYIRPEQKFNGINELTTQILKDIAKCKLIIEN